MSNTTSVASQAVYNAPLELEDYKDLTDGEGRRETFVWGDSILDEMHKLNIRQAKLAVYTDYYRLRAISLATVPKLSIQAVEDLTPTDIGRNISRYARAVAEYKAFADAQCAAFDWVEAWTGTYLHEWKKPENFENQMMELNDQKTTLRELSKRKVAIRRFELRHGGASRTLPDAHLKRQSEIIEAQEKLMLRNLELSEVPKDVNSIQKRYERMSTQTRLLIKFSKRLYMALFGGLILIAPMLIMRLHPDLLTVILTTSIFVVMVSIILAAVMTTAETKDILGTAAAYAAVLVVFVGQSTEFKPSSWSNGTIAGLTVGVIVGLSLMGGSLAYLWTRFRK